MRQLFSDFIVCYQLRSKGSGVLTGAAIKGIKTMDKLKASDEPKTIKLISYSE